MIRKAIIGVLTTLYFVPILVTAAEIGNGWSAGVTIAKINSHNTYTLFRLNGVSDSCGQIGPDFWKLPLSDMAKDKAKLSMLLMAHATGKRVSLRCESYQVTDFEILE